MSWSERVWKARARVGIRLTWVVLAVFVVLCRVDLAADGLPSPASDAPVIEAAASQPPHRWGVLIYHSLMTENSIWEVLSARVNPGFGFMDSVDISYELAHENVFQLQPGGDYPFFRPFAGSLYLAANITRRTGDPRGSITEFDPYVMWRTRPMTLGKALATTWAFGDGMSYATRVPERENGDKMMNFMTIEGTLDIPSHQATELVFRIHHRCNAWGLFGPGTSTNAVGFGIRRSF